MHRAQLDISGLSTQLHTNRTLQAHASEEDSHTLPSFPFGNAGNGRETLGQHLYALDLHWPNGRAHSRPYLKCLWKMRSDSLERKAVPALDIHPE